MKWRSLAGLGPWWAVAAVAATGLGLSIRGEIRTGGAVVTGAFLLAAVLRLVLPTPRGGGIEVRSRWLDVLMFGLGAVAVLVAFNLVNLAPR